MFLAAAGDVSSDLDADWASSGGPHERTDHAGYLIAFGRVNFAALISDVDVSDPGEALIVKVRRNAQHGRLSGLGLLFRLCQLVLHRLQFLLHGLPAGRAFL